MATRVKRHAAYCGTRAIYDDMEASAKSLIANSDVDVVHFIIEDAEFPRELPPIIKVHDLSGQTYFAEDGPNMGSGYTYMAMMRMALCHILPRVGKVLSLDADTVCVGDVSDVWDIDLTDYYLAASHEWHRTGNGLLYCNAGVTLYNLAKLRDGKADECIGVLNTRQYTWLEQDVQNYLCQGRIYDMPSKYNSNWWTDKNARGARIVHFAGVEHKKWENDPRVVGWRTTEWDDVIRQHADLIASKK